MFCQINDFLILLIALDLGAEVPHRSVENESDVAHAQSGNLADFLVAVVAVKAKADDVLLIAWEGFHMLHQAGDLLAAGHVLQRGDAIDPAMLKFLVLHVNIPVLFLQRFEGPCV